MSRGMGASAAEQELSAYRTIGSALNPFDWSSVSAFWCDKTGLCSDEMVIASRALRNPDLHYPSMAMPPTVKPPSNIVNPTETPQDLSNQQILDWQSQNRRYFENVAALNSPDSNGGKNNFGMWLLLAGVGLFGAVTLLSPGPRRYGR